MINYKIAFQKGSQKAQHYNHFSQVKLPVVDKKVAENMKKSLSKLKATKLPLLNFHVPPPLSSKLTFPTLKPRETQSYHS
jgi:hypothetical protein